MKKKINLSKIFPGDYDWKCPDCSSWNRAFEKEVGCPNCNWEKENKEQPKMVVIG